MTHDHEPSNNRTEVRRDPSPAGGRLRWHHIYYLLAAFDVATVSFTLLLTHEILNIHRSSVEENQLWTARSVRFGDLAQLSSSVNAPGNDIFASKDATRESSRLEAAMSEYKDAVVMVRSELEGQVEENLAAPLTAALDRSQFAMQAMANEARAIFRHFDDEPIVAGQHMAAMDQRYAEVRAALDVLHREVGVIQASNLERQHEAAAALGRYEYVVGSFIILMVMAITVYGRRLSRKIEKDQRERDVFLENLREAEATTRAILETAVEGIVTIDARGVIEAVNPAAEQIFDYTASELIGQNVSILIPMPIRAEHDTYLERYISGGEPHIIGLGGREVLAQRKNGTVFPLELAVSEVRRGNTIRFTGLLHDISERKRAEELTLNYAEELEATVSERTSGLVLALKKESELAENIAEAYEVIRQTQDKLMRKERLAAVGELATAVAHGLRNPLASIRACAEVERSGMTEEHPIARTLADIICEVDRMGGRIKAVLDFARPLEPATIPINLNDALDLLARNSRERVLGGVDIEVDLDPTLPTALFDPAHEFEILDALVNNAFEAMNGKGKLTLRSRLDTRDDSNPVAVLSVSDTGPGIEEYQRLQIFDLFYTNKPSGTGIGLAMAMRIVKSQGGTIEVKSEPGEGATFEVRIPLRPLSVKHTTNSANGVLT